MTAAEPSRRFDRTIAIAFLAFVVLGLPDGLLGLAWPSMRSQFALGQDSLGVFLGASIIGYMLTSFFSGKLQAHFPIGWLLVLAFAVRGGAAIAILGAPSWIVVVMLGFTASLGSGMIDSGLNTYVADYASARLMNWLHAAFGVGATIGPILMTELFDAGIRWQWGYGIVGIVQLGMIPLMLWTLARWQPRSLDENEQNGVRAPLRSTLLMPAALIGIVMFAVYAGLEISAGNWSYTLFTEGRGINPSLAGRVISIYWGSFTIGRILFGIVGNRWSESAVVRTAIGGLLVGSTLIWLNLANVLTFAGLTLMGIALAPIFPLLINNTAARLSKRHAANAIGLQIAAAGFGGAVLPGAIGVTAENYGLETIGPWLLAMSAVSLFLHEALLHITIRRQRTETLAPAPIAKLPGD